MFCHRNFCDQYVINGLKPLKMGPNCTERKWIIIQPSMWRVSIYNTFQREELVRRSIFTEGKFLVYKSQDALRRQLKHCDKKHQWVNFTKTQGEVCGGSTDDDDGGGAAARILGAGPSRGVSDCWRLRIQIFSHFALAAANEGDVSAKTRWHKDKGMLPSNFEVLSTLWCLIERPHEDPNLADFWTHDGRMSLWVGRGMSLCKGSLAECLGCQAVPIRTPWLDSDRPALKPSAFCRNRKKSASLPKNNLLI